MGWVSPVMPSRLGTKPQPLPRRLLARWPRLVCLVGRLGFVMPVAGVVMSQSPEHAITVDKNTIKVRRPGLGRRREHSETRLEEGPWEGWPSQERIVASGKGLGSMARLARALSVS